MKGRRGVLDKILQCLMQHWIGDHVVIVQDQDKMIGDSRNFIKQVGQKRFRGW